MNNINKSVITDAILNYDKLNETNKFILKGVTYYQIIFNDNNAIPDKLFFYNDDKKKIGEAKYENIGKFNQFTYVWEWAWADPTRKKKHITIIKKLWLYGSAIEAENLLHLKFELMNSKFIMTDLIQIDIHLALVSSISKIPFILEIPTLKKDDFDSEYFSFKINNEEMNIVHYVFLFDIVMT